MAICYIKLSPLWGLDAGWRILTFDVRECGLPNPPTHSSVWLVPGTFPLD